MSKTHSPTRITIDWSHYQKKPTVMSLNLHTSNRTENLLLHLAKVIEKPLSSPFVREVLLIQSRGMERWLLQQLSLRRGIMAHYQLRFPQAFFNQLAVDLAIEGGLNAHHFSRERLVWEVEAVLRTLADEVGFESVNAYLAQGQVAVKRFQLAQVLTYLYDQYQVFRPHWMNETAPENWVLKIWQRVLARMPQTQGRHIGLLWADLVSRLEQAPIGSLSAKVPERLLVFGIHSMPVVFVKVLKALSQHTQVHLFVTQPTEGYWADLRSRAEVTQEKVRRVFVEQASAEAADCESHHPLLSLLGQQGRDFHQLLVERCEFDWQFDSFEEQGTRALHRLQGAMLHNQSSQKIVVEDDSIQVVSCFSRWREVQVLKDALLQALSSDKTLELRDIVVMAPDISLYEPYIETEFGRDASHRLPYALADHSSVRSQAALKFFLAVFRVVTGRFEASEVMGLLAHPPLMRYLELEERDLEQIEVWVAQSEIRWARDAGHCEALGLPPIEQNTWAAGMTRMMRAWVMQQDSWEIEGAQVLLLSKIYSWLRTLRTLAEQVAHARAPAAWADELKTRVAEWLDPQDAEVQAILQVLEGLSEVSTREPVSIAVVLSWLEDAMAERKTSQGFMAGQLTFCSILPMRSIPFRFVAVLGLNDGEFPKEDRAPSFDLMAQEFQLGDRSARVDDRYQFLEIVLNARDWLYLSYVGQSSLKAQKMAPSIVLSELMDELVLTPIEHPLQPFSARYFQAESPLENTSKFNAGTYRASAWSVAQAFAQPQKRSEIWWPSEGRLPAYDSHVIECEDWLACLSDPQRWFLTQRMGVHLSQFEEVWQDHEPFEMQGLDRYRVEQKAFEALRAGKSLESVAQSILASGAWMPGAWGAARLDEHLLGVAHLHEGVRALCLGAALEPWTMEGSLGRFQLTGFFSGQYEGGFLYAKYAVLKPKDFIQAWLITGLTGRRVFIVGLDDKRAPQIKTFASAPVDLMTWLKVYLSAFEQPSDFWPELGWAYWKAVGVEGANDWGQVTFDEEQDRAGDKAAYEVFKKRTQVDAFLKNRPDPYAMQLTRGRSFSDVWSAQAKRLTLDLCAPIMAALEETPV